MVFYVMPKSIITLKNHLQETQLFTQRIIAVGLLLFVISALVLLRLVYLQIYQHNLYTTLSEQNQLTLMPLEPKRGLIYDRNGILLAENTPVFSLEIIPDYAPNLRETIQKLRKIIQLSDDDIREFNKQLRQTHHFRRVPLKIRLSEEEVARFSQDQYHYPGASIHARLIRHYPLGKTFAHVIGYVGRINAKEWSTLDTSNYSGTDYIGKIGIEKFYETQLHGTTGYEQVETDASGRIIRVMKRVPPIAGDNLHLAIDSRLSLAAEAALGENAGAIIAIDPKNGQLLAMVSNPSYDPNQFLDKISPAMYRTLQQAPDRPLYNRAIRGVYPMASTIKPFLAIGALEANIIDTEYTIQDRGFFTLRGSSHRYRDWWKSGHGLVNVSKAITQSCDTFFFTVAMKMGIDRMDNILWSFGFGKLTGIDMGEELPGNVATPAWKLKRHHHAWAAGDTVNSAIGQGFMLTTPLQLAHATATLAMHGKRYQPALLVMRETAYGQKLIQQPVLKATVPLQADNWQTVADAMRDVISSPSGTARGRFGINVGYEVAGKTGTAQVFSLKQNQQNIHLGKSVIKALRNHGLFIAYAPITQPKIAISVIVEHENIAPNIGRVVLDTYLRGGIKK